MFSFASRASIHVWEPSFLFSTGYRLEELKQEKAGVMEVLQKAEDRNAELAKEIRGAEEAAAMLMQMWIRAEMMMDVLCLHGGWEGQGRLDVGRYLEGDAHAYLHEYD